MSNSFALLVLASDMRQAYVKRYGFEQITIDIHYSTKCRICSDHYARVASLIAANDKHIV